MWIESLAAALLLMAAVYGQVPNRPRVDALSRAREYLHLVEQSPASKQLRHDNQNIFILTALNQTDTYARASVLWNEIAWHSQSPEAVVNAAIFIENCDTAEAYKVYKPAYTLDRRNQAVVESFARYLAVSAGSSFVYQSGNLQDFVLSLDFGRSQADRLKHELETSGDPHLLAEAAHFLTLQINTGNRIVRRSEVVRKFGFALYQRAERLDPGNPRWPEMQRQSEQVVDMTDPKKRRVTLVAFAIPDIPVTPAKLRDHLLKSSAAETSGLVALLHLQGDVRFAVRVDSSDHIQQSNVLSGNPLLRSAARNALKNWQFIPFYRDRFGAVVSSELTVPVRSPA